MSNERRAAEPRVYGAPSRFRRPSLTLLAAAVATVGSVTGLEAAAPGGEWWRAGYFYRKQLNLTAGDRNPHPVLGSAPGSETPFSRLKSDTRRRERSPSSSPSIISSATPLSG